MCLHLARQRSWNCWKRTTLRHSASPAWCWDDDGATDAAVAHVVHHHMLCPSVRRRGWRNGPAVSRMPVSIRPGPIFSEEHHARPHEAE
ncbi:unnamed protein product [Urochloa humidicola]